MDQSREEGACGEHDGARSDADTDLRDHPGHPVAIEREIVDRLLKNVQVGFILKPTADRFPVEQAIRLRARCAHGGTFARIEDAKLDAGFVGCRGHGTAQRVNFLDKMALADTADRRVARHLAQRLDIVGQQQGVATHARRR